MQDNNDLTRGRVSARLLGFFFPMLLTNTLQQAYTFVDTIIVGKGIGDQALGAVGNLSSLSLLITGFLMGVTNGFSVNIAQSFGAGDHPRLRRYAAHALQLCAIMTAALTLLAIVLLQPLLAFMQTSPVLMRDSLVYGYILFSGLAVNAAYSLCSGVLRALGDSRTPFRAIIIASIANILLDCLLIFGLRMGVEGAAIATLLAQGISTLVCLHKLRGNPLLRLQRSDFTPDRAADFNLLANGVPAACMNSVTAVGCMVVQGYVNALGTAFTSAYSACSRYLNLFMLPSVTAGFSLSAFVSQNKGAGLTQRIRQGVRTGAGIAIVSWVMLGGAMLLLPRQLAGLILTGDDTIALAEEFLRICGVTLIFLNLLFVFRCAVQGLGRPMIPMWSGILEMALRIPVIVLLIGSLGYEATAWAESIAWLGALALNGAAYIVYIRK